MTTTQEVQAQRIRIDSKVEYSIEKVPKKGDTIKILDTRGLELVISIENNKKAAIMKTLGRFDNDIFRNVYTISDVNGFRNVIKLQPRYSRFIVSFIPECAEAYKEADEQLREVGL